MAQKKKEKKEKKEKKQDQCRCAYDPGNAHEYIVGVRAGLVFAIEMLAVERRKCKDRTAIDNAIKQIRASVDDIDQDLEAWMEE